MEFQENPSGGGSLCSIWAGGHMTKLIVVFSSCFVNVPNKTAANSSQIGTPSVWHYTIRTKMSLPLSQGRQVYILRQINPLHALPPSVCLGYVSTFISHLPTTCKCLLPVWFLKQTLVCISHCSLACYISSPSEILNLVNLTTGELHIFWSSLCNFLQLPVTSSLLG
jgi:hypothetical protein